MIKITPKALKALFLGICLYLAACESEETVVEDCDPKAPNVASLSEPKEEALNVVRWVTEILAVNPDYIVYAATFKPGESSGAYATTKCNKQYIVYDQHRLFLSKEKIVEWGSVYVTAHEVVHHTSSASYILENFHNREIEADKGAGFVLRNMHATIEQATAYALREFPEEGSITHPGREKRLDAIIEGWHQADDLLARHQF